MFNQASSTGQRVPAHTEEYIAPVNSAEAIGFYLPVRQSGPIHEDSAFLKTVYKVDKKRKYVIFYNKIRYFSYSLLESRPVCFHRFPRTSSIAKKAYFGHLFSLITINSKLIDKIGGSVPPIENGAYFNWTVRATECIPLIQKWVGRG